MKKLATIALAGALSITGLAGAGLSDSPLNPIAASEASAAEAKWNGKAYSDLRSQGYATTSFGFSSAVRGVAKSFDMTYEIRDTTQGSADIYRVNANNNLVYVTSTKTAFVSGSDGWNTYKHTFTIPTSYAAGTYVVVYDHKYDFPGEGTVPQTNFKAFTVN